MTTIRKKLIIALLTVLLVLCGIGTVLCSVTGLAPSAETTLDKRDLCAYLADQSYTSSSAHASGKATVDVNAVDGGRIALGPQSAFTLYNSGLSLLTPASGAAYIEVTLPEGHDFTLFDVNFGIDAVQASGKTAVVRLIVDGQQVAQETVASDQFHKKFCISAEDVNVIRLEAEGAEGTCVSFGDAVFYTSSANAVTKRIENTTYGAWPVPVQRNYDLYGNALTIAGQRFDYGFSVNATAEFDLIIDGEYGFFETWLGISDYVAGGANAGSVSVIAEAYDAEGTLLTTTQSETVYGYMQPLKFIADVRGASKIHFTVNDGGDGISDDMLLMASPVFTQSMGEGRIYMSDLAFGASNIGWGTSVGRDQTTEGQPLTYQIYATQVTYQKGIGLHLVDVPYTTYQQDPTNPLNFSYLEVDITGMEPDFFEAYVADPASSGAYYELWADGVKIAGTDKILGFTSSPSPYPYRLAAKIPAGTKKFQIRVIADTTYANGRIDFCNAAFYKSESSIGYSFIEEETVAPAWPYKVNRGLMFVGETAKMHTADGDRYFPDSLSSNSGSSYVFDISGKPYDTFEATVGLAYWLVLGDVTFEAEVTYEDGSTKTFTSPAVTFDNSGYFFSCYYGENAKTLKLSVLDNGDPAEDTAIWGSPRLTKTQLSEKEYLTDLNIVSSATGWGNIGINESIMGEDITINGKVYENGISLHAFDDDSKYAYVEYQFPADFGYTVFESYFGLNDDTANGSAAGTVQFLVEGDGRILFDSNLVKYGTDLRHVVVDITGVSRLRLMIGNADGSYQCDWGVWVSPVIAKSSELLDGYLSVESPVDGQAVVLSGEGKFEVSGVALGADREVRILLNGQQVTTAQASELGTYAAEISVTEPGVNVITALCADMEQSVTVRIADMSASSEEFKLSTDSMSVSFKAIKNGIAVTDLSTAGGYDWLGGGESYIPFLTDVKLGGKDGEDYTIDWVFEGEQYTETPVVSKNINSAHEDYNGKLAVYTLTFKDSGGKFTLRSVWSAHVGFDAPVQHRIDIVNESGEPVLVTAQDSYALNLQRPDGSRMTNSYAYKGAVYTTNYGYREDEISNGYQFEVFSTAEYNNGTQIDAGYIPWVSLNAQPKDGQAHGLYFGVVWPDARIDVSGVGTDVYVEAGMRETFRTVIPAGDTYGVPAVFVGAYEGDVDDGSNTMKDWLFAFMMPEANRLDESLPSFGYNLWEVLDSERRSWRMSDAKFYDTVMDLYGMGIDEITIDTYWWKDIGDWRGVHEKWQSSIEYSSNYVNALDMAFTLYMQAGNGSSKHSDAMSAVGVNGNNDWFARGDNVFWSELCTGDPDAKAYLEESILSSYMELGLNGMRTDFGWIIGYCDKEGHDHTYNRTDVGYWTAKNTYEILDKLYEMYPVPTDVNAGSEVNYFKWENCNCGGTLKDFASMSRATRIQTTDAYDAVQVRQSFYDSSYAFPSMQLMLWFNDYMYNPDGPVKNDQYRFWSVLMGSPVFMTSAPADMPADMRAELVNTIRIYDTWMKDLVKYGNVYHNMPRCDGDNWDGIEYYDDYTGKGAVLAFKPNTSGNVADTYQVQFKGLDDEKSYYVWSENGNIAFDTYTGAQLKEGIDLTLPGSYQAEIIYFMATDAAGAEEVVAAPGSFSVNAAEQDGKLGVELEESAGADYYLVEIYQGEEKRYEYVTVNTSDVQLINGLAAGDYRIAVTAFNRFGQKTEETQVTLSGSAFVGGGYPVTGDTEDGAIVIDGEYYVTGSKLVLEGDVFSANVSKTLTLEPGDARTLQARLALNFTDEAEQVRITVTAVGAEDRTVMREVTLDKESALADLEAEIPEGTQSIEIAVENLSPDVYYQTATGYGRTGLYAGEASEHYEFSFDVQVIRSGLNETFPRAGGFAAYVDDDHFAAVYLDAYYGNIVIYERANGQDSDVTTNIRMPEDFDYHASHNFRIVRSGNTFTYYVDGEKIAERTLSLAASKVALITEDAVARFANVQRIVDGEAETLSFSAYNVGVNIKDKTIYSTKVTEGVWKKLAPEVVIIV